MVQPTNVTVIGRTTRVVGRLTGAVDLEIQGFVEGDIAVGGDVTVAAQGIVGANVRGRRLLVRGAVKGDLVGDESILLEQGARVVGDVRAPRVAIAPGALVRGHVQTGEGDAPAAARAARPQQALRPVPAMTTAVAAATAKAVVATPPKIAAKPSPPPARVAPLPAPTPAASARRPPPPVVPALRSSKGQIAKKKER
jgi:cytoskeletal protein CcmA (bactofilin family)